MTNRRARAARRCGHTFRYPLAEGFLLGEMQDRRSVRTVKMRGPAGLSLAAAAAVPGRGRCRPEGGGARSRRWRGMEWPVHRRDRMVLVQGTAHSEVGSLILENSRWQAGILKRPFGFVLECSL